ncbi:hypothetical protein ACFQNF_05665 [Iodobacter arcticus]|uniref:Bacteriophage lysis protein n=1 Tax=Iodobacter arcticus TaxID=590593 RepID=A0ABW2QZU5_9NEIS
MLPDSIFSKFAFMGYLFATGIALGGYGGFQWATSMADAELADQREAALLGRLELAHYNAELQSRIQAHGEKLASELDQTRAQLNEARVQLSRSVSRVTTIYKASPNAAPQPLPAAVFTTGFVRVWNSALAMPATSDQQTTTNIADAASACDSADCLLASSITQADILTNHIDNALRCQSIEAQLNQLINWHEGQ